jgi:hypothetical protein
VRERGKKEWKEKEGKRKKKRVEETGLYVHIDQSPILASRM